MTKTSLKKSTQKFTKGAVKDLKEGKLLDEDFTPVSKRSFAMSTSNISNLSLHNKKRKKVEISTTSLKRGEMFDKLLSTVTVSIFKLVRQ